MFAPWCHPNATVNWVLSGTQSEHSESKGRMMSDRSVCVSIVSLCNSDGPALPSPSETESACAAFAGSKFEVSLREFASGVRSSVSEFDVSGAYSPALRPQSSVRGVVGSALSAQSRSLRTGASPSAGVCVVALRSSPAPQGSVSRVLRPESGPASPKPTLSLALRSARQAARARKVARIAQRLAGIAERHRRQHCDE